MLLFEPVVTSIHFYVRKDSLRNAYVISLEMPTYNHHHRLRTKSTLIYFALALTVTIKTIC